MNNNATNRVKIHFSETSKETMSDKIKRLILNDSENFLYSFHIRILSCFVLIVLTPNAK